MVRVRFDWGGFHGSSVRRRVADGHDRPTVKLLAGGALSPTSCPCERRHLVTCCMIHSIHGNPIVFPAYKKRLRNGPGSSGLSGQSARKHTPTQTLCLVQRQHPVIQRSARGPTRPTFVIVPSRTRQAVETSRRSARAGFLRVSTSSSLRLPCCPRESTTRRSQSET